MCDEDPKEYNWETGYEKTWYVIIVEYERKYKYFVLLKGSDQRDGRRCICRLCCRYFKKSKTKKPTNETC